MAGDGSREFDSTTQYTGHLQMSRHLTREMKFIRKKTRRKKNKKEEQEERRTRRKKNKKKEQE